MGGIRDEFEADRSAEANQKILDADQKKIERQRERVRVESNCDFARAQLNDLKSEVQPMFDELRKDWRALFMFPNIRMLRVVQNGSTANPKLICNYGLRKERSPSATMEKVRSLVTYDVNEKKFKVIPQMWKHPHGGGSMQEAPPKTWVNIKSGVPTETYSKDETVQLLREELKKTYASHKRDMPKRVGIGAATLAAIFAISYFSDADASTHTEEPNKDIPTSEQISSFNND